MDAVFRSAQEIREAAKQAAQKKGLEEHWLNDGVKGFLSSSGEFQTLDNLPDFSHLQVIAPAPQYPLAMKCMAARTPGYETSGDKNDVKFLAEFLKLTEASEAISIVEHYYGNQPIHVKTRFFVEEVFQEIAEETS